jgi:hypothetical protein
VTYWNKGASYVYCLHSLGSASSASAAGNPRRIIRIEIDACPPAGQRMVCEL